MKTRYTVAAAALTLPAVLPLPALAVDLGNGINFSGTIKLEAGSSELVSSTTSRFAFGDLQISWRNPAQGAIGYGFDLDISTIRDVGGTSSYGQNTYLSGGLVLTTSVGDFTLGRASSITSALSPVPDLAASNLTELFFAGYGVSSKSFTDSAAAKLLGTVPEIMGASFVGKSGAFEYGIARHWLKRSGTFDLNVTEATLVYTANNIRAYAGIEHIEGGSSTVTRRLAGLSYTMGPVLVGGDLIVADSSGDDTARRRIFANYAVNDRLELGLDATQINYASGMTQYIGGRATYTLANGAFAQLGFARANRDTIDDTATLVVGYKF